MINDINCELQNEFTIIHESQNKPKIKKSIKYDSSKNILNISYENFVKSKVILKTYKIPELKKAAKKFNLHISGTKKILIQRLEEYFNKCKKSIVIQKVFRSSIVQKSFKMRGPAINDRKKCVNDTDFVIMEPLAEIPFEQFFSYTDSHNFIYGFNIGSLIQIIKKTKNEKTTNPYNREPIPNNIISDIITLYKISYIIYPNFKDENEVFMIGPNYKRQYNLAEIREHSNINTNINRIEDENRNIQDNTNIMTAVYRPLLNRNRFTMEELIRYEKIEEMRTKPLNQRINELFIEIDHLGNYTQSNWFSNLDIRAYNRLYRSLYDIWNYRSQMNMETKQRICPFHGPFDSIFTRPVQYNMLSYEQIKLACLIVMENMVYSGVDEEYRKIGCFHALSGLTIVSMGARTSMIWLYESVIY
jgi:hypothetical protein